MAQFNYRLLEVARNSRGLSQKDLAGVLQKLNQSSISKIERGELTPSKEDIASIARVVGYPQEFFYRTETKMPVCYIYYRKRATLPKKEHDRILAETHQVILSGIDTLLEEIDIKEYPKFVFDIKEGWTPKTAATRLREIMQLHPERPVTEIVKRIEDLGIIVFLYDSLSDKFDGMTSYTNGGVPVIFVNKNSSPERIKRTLIHEIFHLVLHIPCNVEPWRNVEDEVEEATSEFYMPEKAIYKELQNLSYSKLGPLKSYWGVSKASIIRWAKDLGCITKETYTYLNIELGRKGERKKETGYVELDKPKIIPSIIALLKQEVGYSSEDLAIKVGLDRSDYTRFFEHKSNPGDVKLRVVQNIA